jgi:hypothetical protein
MRTGGWDPDAFNAGVCPDVESYVVSVGACPEAESIRIQASCSQFSFLL